VIRNNRITVDAATAIVAQGPGIIIENNVIEVRNHLEALSEFDRSIDSKTPFAIRLIQADGAIVRNNEIRLLDREGRGGLPAAIDLVSTRGALVEGNVSAGWRPRCMQTTRVPIGRNETKWSHAAARRQDFFRLMRPVS
jgi:hypothetical protein